MNSAYLRIVALICGLNLLSSLTIHAGSDLKIFSKIFSYRNHEVDEHLTDQPLPERKTL